MRMSSLTYILRRETKCKEFHLLPAETEEGGKGLEKENQTLRGLEPFPDPS